MKKTCAALVILLVASASDSFAEVYTINGRVSSTVPNFFRDNTVTVGCNSEGCAERATVASDGSFTLVRDTGTIGAVDTSLTYYVTNKLDSSKVLYNVKCNEEGYGQTVLHGTKSGTFTAREIVFKNLDVQATRVSSSGQLKPGAKVRVKARTDNVGDQTIYDNFSVGIYLLNKPSFAAASTWQRIGTYMVTTPFEPGYYDEQTVAVTIPKKLKAGTYYLGIIADVNTNLNECYLNTKFDPSIPADNGYLASPKALKIKK